MSSWLSYAKNIARLTLAYKAFLKKKKVTISKIKSFQELPITDKKNYINAFTLEQLIARRTTPPFAYASSGSSGKQTFWFRGDEEEKRGGDIHESIVRDIWKIPKSSKTLVVVCFSMGVWVAGGFTAAAFRELSRRGYQMTTVTPGLERKDIAHIIHDLLPHYDRLIFAGYPPFLLDVLRDIKQWNIPIPKHTYLLTAGDSVRESLRDSYLELLKTRDPARAINMYGCADAGPLAYETRLTIALRRACINNSSLQKAIFGASIEKPDSLPALFQYNPKDIFFEQQKDELIFSARTTIPLVRYNIHDIGELISFARMKKISSSLTNNNSLFRLPFIVKRGRTDVAVTFYALNIYPEHIFSGFSNSTIAKTVSGQFLAYTKPGEHTAEELYIDAGLQNNIQATEELQMLVQKSMTEALLANNMEYRKLFNTIGDAALPHIRLIESDKFEESDISRGILGMKGKKPRMIVNEA